MSGAAVATVTVCTKCTEHTEAVFRVSGLCCGEEATLLRRRLTPLPGMEEVVADVVGQRLHVKYDAALLAPAAIVREVAATGMHASLERDAAVARRPTRARGALSLLAGMTLAGVLLAQYAVGPRPWFAAALLAVVVLGGIFPARRAVLSLRNRVLDINVLMLVAVAGAIAIGEWEEAATVVFLFSVAQWLEANTLDRARAAIRALVQLTPTQARVRRGSGEELLAVARVPVGAVMLIRPGERIPLDGTVSAGHSDVNQAPITGESLPIDKAPGDEVFAGTINGLGALDVTVTRHSAETALARIVHLVEVAQAERAPSQQFIERFARFYTPAVLLLAVLLATVPPLFVGAPGTWFYRALVLLVVSCPCALVISTPVSIVSALAGAARRGVLVKGGRHLERLAAVRALAMDKTGTLTRASLQVIAVRTRAPMTEPELLRLAAAVEARSEHPIGAAVVTAARARALALPTATAVRIHPGLGIEGTVEGRQVACGNARWFLERAPSDPATAARVRELLVPGASTVLVASDGELIGSVAVADEAREQAANAVDLLRQHGITPIVMLTGDEAAAARAIAAAVRVDDVRSGLLPHEKVAAVQELQRAHGVVAMVGDGVNDAPALAAADVGIAMGAIGSSAALETADIALMTDDLSKLAYAVRLARATVRNIRANVAVSLLLKAAFVVLAVSGAATLWMAVIADTGASMIVVANAVRLLRYR